MNSWLQYSQTTQPAPPQLPGVRPGQPLSVDAAVNRLAGPSDTTVPQQPDGSADPLLQAFEQAFISGQVCTVAASIPSTVLAADEMAVICI